MLSIDRRDIINDDLGAITLVPRAGGPVSRSTTCSGRPSSITPRSSRPATSYISGAGTALSIDGLTQAETTFMEQVDADGKPIASCQVHARSAELALGRAFRSLEPRDTSSNVKYPIRGYLSKIAAAVGPVASPVERRHGDSGFREGEEPRRQGSPSKTEHQHHLRRPRTDNENAVDDAIRLTSPEAGFLTRKAGSVNSLVASAKGPVEVTVLTTVTIPGARSVLVRHQWRQGKDHPEQGDDRVGRRQRCGRLDTA